jgi:hypothetical protein
MLQSDLPTALGAALDVELQHDRSVYVVRSIRCRAIACLGDRPVQAVARQLSAQILRAARSTTHDAQHVVRFDDEADYLAQFLADSLLGNADGKWYYEPLRGRSHGSTADLVHDVIAERRSNLPDVLGALHARGLLSTVLEQLDEATLGSLWLGSRRDELTSGGARDVLAGGYEGSTDGHDRGTADSVGGGKRTTSPSPSAAGGREAGARSDLDAIISTAVELVDELGGSADLRGSDAWRQAYLRTRPVEPDWRDTGSLTDAIVDLVHWLCESGWVTPPGDVDVRAISLSSRFGWLDATRVHAGLRHVLTHGGRPASTPTPRQVALRAALALAVDACWSRLDPATPNRNAWTIWAELIAGDRRWDGDDLAHVAVTRLAATLSPGPRQLDRSPARARSDGEAGRVPSANVGILLLTRALHDLRLPTLIADAGLAPRAVLAAVARRWAAPGDGWDDPMQMAFSTAAVGDLAPISVAAAAHWQELLIATLVGQRAAELDRVRLRRVPFGRSSTALIAGDPADRIWVAGEIDAGDAPVERLLARWKGATGQRPVSELMVPDRADAGRDALLEALATLAHGHSGTPAVDLALDIAAMVILRVWARWLRGFGAASIPYLLRTFIRRPGDLIVDGDVLVVRLRPRPHDVALQVAGYLAPFEPPDASGWRRLRFEIAD